MKDKKENQIGCGYCSNEEVCKIRDPKVNKAKKGCEDYIHYEDNVNQKVKTSTQQ